MSRKPTEVERVDPVKPGFSSVKWKVVEPHRLNRRNKISSLPFWVGEGSVEKQYQFRLVALRGIVKGETETDDPLAIFVEYLLPPTETDGKDPGQCELVCSVMNQHTPISHDKNFSFTGSLSRQKTSCGFRHVLDASDLDEGPFVTEDSSIFVVVSIQPNAETVSDAFVKTTEKVTSSLWAGASSAFAFVSSTVKKAASAMEPSAPPTAEQEEDFTSRTAHKSTPWEELPPKWQDRKERWIELVTLLLPEDENTFLLGNDRVLTVDQQLLMSQVGLNYRSVMSANSMFDYDQDVHEGLLDVDSLRAKRYELVPRCIDDTTFWKNYLWRVTALSVCSTNEQAQVLVAVLNAPMNDVPKPSSQVSVTTDVEVSRTIQSSLEAASFLTDLLEDTQKGEDDMLRTATASCNSAKISLEKLRSKVDTETQLQSIDAAMTKITDALEEQARRNEEAVTKEGIEHENTEKKAEQTQATHAIESVEPMDTDTITPSKTDITKMETKPQSTTSGTIDDYFDDFPEIDDVSSSPVKVEDPSPDSKTFAVMPWEEDDE